MITSRLTNCSSAPDILSLIKDIDHKLMSLSNDLYNNSVFMLNRQINAETFVDLIAYKRILTYKYCNEDYTDFTLPQIVTRVKRLTLGVSYVDCDDFVRTSTTSTTPVPTTSTTSTTAVPTTTTTTAIPPTTTSTTTNPAVTTTTTAVPTTTTSTTPVPTTTTTTTAVGSVKCGTSTSFPGGQSYPTTKIVNVGSAIGTVGFYFSAASIPDKFEVWFDGVKVVDTGYRGSTYYQSDLNAALLLKGDPLETITTPSNGTIYFEKGTATSTVEVRVYAPLTGTAWNFTVNCPTNVTTTTTTVAPTTTTTTTIAVTTTTTTTVAIVQPQIGLISSTSNLSDGCLEPLDSVCYINTAVGGTPGIISVGDFVYNFITETSPIIGNNEYFKISLSGGAIIISAQIDNSGQIIGVISIC